ncbi:MAG TPA: hypothetical protein VNY36_01405 [Bacteroidia bacterium]|jgi:hypothetical protein|nr:hypothetical protein [Bacteroidia bacterium]
MKVLVRPKRNLLQKVEMILHEVYDRSIYKRMVQDFTRANANKYKQPGTIESAKKGEAHKKDINDDLPGMLFI